AAAKKLTASATGRVPGRGYTIVGDDGTFQLVTVPGLVLLEAGVDGSISVDGVRNEHKFRPSTPDPKYPDYFIKREPFWAFHAVIGSIGIQGNFCKVVDIPPDATEVKQDIELERAPSVAVEIRDGDGKSVKGALVAGTGRADWYQPLRCSADHTAVYD